jgi:hypothetical protein
MRKQRRQKVEQTITLRLWTLAGAKKAAPYFRSLVQSLRDRWLELRDKQQQVRRIESRPGRPDRDSLILLEDSRRDLARAESNVEEVIQEMVGFSIYGIDPAAGLAGIPSLHDKTLAWLIFDLYDPSGLVAWRLHSDPLETRRPLAGFEEQPSTAPDLAPGSFEPTNGNPLV